MKGEIIEENKVTSQSIDEYIFEFPPEIRELLETIRKVIKESVPGAKEKISYGMPTFYKNMLK